MKGFDYLNKSEINPKGTERPEETVFGRQTENSWPREDLSLATLTKNPNQSL